MDATQQKFDMDRELVQVQNPHPLLADYTDIKII